MALMARLFRCFASVGMLAAALTGTPLSLLDDAIEHYRTVENYQVTLRAFRAEGEDHLRYFYRKPGFVRMEFICPHAGAVLVYSPFTRHVRLWPFGAGRFPELSLRPHNPLIRSPRGQTVDRSDVGALFNNVRTLLEQGQRRRGPKRARPGAMSCILW